MESYYEINVAKRIETADGRGYYSHLFATAPRSATNESAARRLFAEIVAAFPVPDYCVTITHWQASGHPVNF